MSVRGNFLGQLKTTLSAVTGINSVVRSYTELDIKQYSEAELPLIEIVEPSEDPDRELTSQHSLVFFDTKLKIWFVDWNDQPQIIYETIMKRIRDTIGGVFTMECKANACYVTSVAKLEGSVPLYSYEMDLRTKIYLNQKNV